jgi:diguanylate cyclase (GGDEF)-like protein/PAS domain S-box-containing protein
MLALAAPASLPSLVSDLFILRRKWQAALTPGQSLPPYEEVALGSLGRLADHLILTSSEAPQIFRVLRVGSSIREWIGTDTQGALVDSLPQDCAATVTRALSQALAAKEPVQSAAYRVREGMVERCDILALPLANRWGAPMVAAYIRAQGAKFSLIDTIFRSTDEGILALTTVRDQDDSPLDFRIVALNEGASRLLGRPESEICWRCLSELDLGLDPVVLIDRLLRTLKTARGPAGDLHLKVGIAAVGDLLSATLTDIGEIKQREASFRLLFDGNPMPMWLYDPDDLKFVAVNDAAVTHYGYSRERFLGMTLMDIWAPDEREVHREIARTVGDFYQSNRTWRHLKADGSEVEVLTYARRIKFAARSSVLVAVVDVTERRQAEARIAYMAEHDALTDLPNRTLFLRRLDEALARIGRQHEALAVLCLDLDHFKSVNDTLGHPVGDRLLREVAARLNACASGTEIVARLGGDEFAIIETKRTGPQELSALAERIAKAVSEPYEIDGHEAIVGASIGIAVGPEDGEASDVLMRNADMALYRAKADGRGTFHFFEAEMDRRIQARRALELDLRKAFQNGEFELYYQPQISLESNAVCGFEALLRWRHSERGMIPPSEFIPLAEDIGLIVPLGEWVLREACAQAATWRGDLKLSVNLSPAQFKSRNLIAAVVGALAASGLAPQRLELEITESVLLSENETNVATLHQLRGLGARISLDDFGTGYSSLSYLRSFPFDRIKIDQSFVRELAANSECLAIIRAVAGLGTSLGIATTAEGVETAEQLERLRQEGCTEVQGYLFSPPRPASELRELMAPPIPKVDAA